MSRCLFQEMTIGLYLLALVPGERNLNLGYDHWVITIELWPLAIRLWQFGYGHSWAIAIGLRLSVYGMTIKLHSLGIGLWPKGYGHSART